MTLTSGREVAELISEVLTIERCLAVKGILNPELRVNDALNLIIEGEEEPNLERYDHEEQDVLPWRG